MTPHSLSSLHEYLGTQFDGESMTKITDNITVGLSLEEFVVYVKDERCGKFPPDKIVKIIKDLMRKEND
jgi:hypothetical protein